MGEMRNICQIVRFVGESGTLKRSDLKASMVRSALPPASVKLP